MVTEARRTDPLESGGILLGWHAADGRDLLAAAMIGPGPDAVHKRTRFEPDSAWQRRELSRVYRDSGRILTYLGDWHSHPGGSDTPSRRDERTARRIARHRSARVREPIMVIVAGQGTRWELAPHLYTARRLKRIEYELTDVGLTLNPK